MSKTPRFPATMSARGRRELLGGLLALGGATLLGCGGAPEAPREGRWARGRALAGVGEPVLIVGGGLAGLVAAWSLERAGMATRVVEAARETGGRVRTRRGLFAGELHAELGGELALPAHAKLQALVRDLRLELDEVPLGGLGLGPVFEVAGKRVAEPDLLAALAPALPSLERDAAVCAAAGVPHAESGRFAELDRTSVSAWLKASGCRSPAREILEAAFTSELGLDPDRAACPPMLVRLAAARGALPMRAVARASRVRGGNDQVVKALTAALPRVETGKALLSMTRRADGRLLASLSGGEEIACEHAILAIPFSVLREVQLDDSLGIDPKQRQAIAELAYGTGAKVVVETIDRPWAAAGKSGEVVTTRPLQAVWDGTGGRRSLGGLLTAFPGGARGADLDRVKPAEIVAELDAIFPGVQASSTGRFALAHWPSEPNARGSYACYAVGQMSAFGGAESLAAGNLHFAGEHTSRVHRGTMEGAVESGLRAAEEILARRGAPG